MAAPLSFTLLSCLGLEDFLFGFGGCVGFLSSSVVPVAGEFAVTISKSASGLVVSCAAVVLCVPSITLVGSLAIEEAEVVAEEDAAAVLLDDEEEGDEDDEDVVDLECKIVASIDSSAGSCFKSGRRGGSGVSCEEKVGAGA